MKTFVIVWKNGQRTDVRGYSREIVRGGHTVIATEAGPVIALHGLYETCFLAKGKAS